LNSKRIGGTHAPDLLDLGERRKEEDVVTAQIEFFFARLQEIMKAFVINLDRAPHKFQRICDRLRAAGIEDIERIEAVDARALTKRDISEISTKTCATFCPREAIAISASHMTAWKRVLESGDDHAMIFEDDAVVVADFLRSVTRLLRDVPKDFDVLLLGCFGLCDPARKGLARHLAPGSMKNSLVHDSRRSVFAPELFAGTHAYIVSKKGCEKLLQRIPKARFHIDWTIASEHAHVNIYAARSDIAFQEHMDDSGTATHRGFPGSVSSVLWNVRGAKGIPWGYYADVRFLRLGTDAVVLSPWHVILFVTGMVSRLLRIPPYILGSFVVADIAFFRPQDTLSRLTSFVLGWTTLYSFR